MRLISETLNSSPGQLLTKTGASTMTLQIHHPTGCHPDIQCQKIPNRYTSQRGGARTGRRHLWSTPLWYATLLSDNLVLTSPRHQWCLLNSFRTGQGQCRACLKRWGQASSDLCECGETQTMSHIVNACPLTKFEGGLQALHEVDEAAVEWLSKR